MVARIVKRSAIRFLALAGLGVCLLPGCQGPPQARTEADRVAYRIIKAKQEEALGRKEPFTIETPAQALRKLLLEGQALPISGPASLGSEKLQPIEHWPEPPTKGEKQPSVQPISLPDPSGPLRLSLVDALQVGAFNSREYQGQKEAVYLAALDLDLEIDRFRNTYTGLLESLLSQDFSAGSPTTTLDSSFDSNVSRKLESGAVLTGRIALDLARLLSADGASAMGILSDASITLPLMRGSGKHIVQEPLTQAQRNALYAIWAFERFKRSFAVQVATEYLEVLQNLDQVQNAQNNYRRQVILSRQNVDLAAAERLPKIQLDQARQAELSARNGWISAREQYAQSLDGFKLILGLPTDCRIELDRQELERLAQAAQKALGEPGEISPEPSIQAPGERAGQEPAAADAEIQLEEPSYEGAGRYEMKESAALGLALQQRLDLKTQSGRVLDAQRAVVVAADALRADVTLTGTASAGSSRSGSATLTNASLRPDRGSYTGSLAVDLPWERTSERNVYRQSLISFQASVRDFQELEDRIKLEIRNGLRTLLEGRESYKIQAMALQLAQRRVDSTKMFRDAGREGVTIRDVLEAEDALLTAQNSLTEALVRYRVAELSIQRDMDVLEVNEKGLWHEYQADSTP